MPPRSWGGVRNLSLHLRNSTPRRYPPRSLFTRDGKLLVAFRVAQSKKESSTLQINEFDLRTGKQIAEHAYTVPSAGPAKISDGFVMAQDGLSLYYVELTGNPVILAINSSSLEIVSQSTSRFFGKADFVPRVELTTDHSLFLSAGSTLAGPAVHLIALDGNNVSKVILDEKIPTRPDWGQSYTLSYKGSSLWMGSGKYWLKIGVKTGQVESKISAKNDVHGWIVFSGGLIGMTDLASDGYLQAFDETGQQLKTMEQHGCGFTSVALSPDDTYGIAVCEKTGTAEHDFGKTIGRQAVVFDRSTMASLVSIKLTTNNLRTLPGTGEVKVWSPQPMVFSSGSSVLIAIPEFDGTVSLQERMLPKHDSQR